MPLGGNELHVGKGPCQHIGAALPVAHRQRARYREVQTDIVRHSIRQSCSRRKPRSINRTTRVHLATLYRNTSCRRARRCRGQLHQGSQGQGHCRPPRATPPVDHQAALAVTGSLHDADDFVSYTDAVTRCRLHRSPSPGRQFPPAPLWTSPLRARSADRSCRPLHR